MQEIIDNTYIFSTSRQEFGNIIVSRSKNRPHTKDVFNHLSLCREEEDFLHRAWMEDGNKVIAVLGKDGKDKTVILFVKDFCGLQSLGLAVEIFQGATAILKKSRAREIENIVMSRRAYELIQYETEGYGEDFERRDYLDSLDEARMIEALACLVEDTIYDVVYAAGRLAGIEAQVSFEALPNEGMGVARQAVAGNESLAILAILAMAAREYSTDRTLMVNVKCLEFGVAVKTSFEIAQSSIGDLARHVSDIASNVEMILSMRLTENRFECGFLPYVRDVGLVGVKAPGEVIERLFHFN